MKRILTVISFLFCLTCSASTIEWNTLTIEKFSGGYYCTAWPLDLVSYGSGDTVIQAQHMITWPMRVYG